MAVPNEILVYEVFIGVYVLTFIATLVCGFRNGFSRAAGFFSLVLFSGSKDLTTWCDVASGLKAPFTDVDLGISFGYCIYHSSSGIQRHADRPILQALLEY